MIEQLLLHERTRAALEALLRSRTHAILLVGAAGAGKGTVATAIALHHQGKETASSLANAPYHKTLAPQDSPIGIETVRELQRFMALKTTGTTPVRRTVIIEDAHSMTTEAQNALLKLLEEPPADTVLILTADHQQHLLPTVNSRLQAIRVLPLPRAAAVAHFAANHEHGAVERAYLLSEGNAGLLHALLLKSTDHPLVANIEQAKQLYGQNTFERLARVDELSKQKTELPGLLGALKRIAKTAMEQAAHKGQSAPAAQWHDRLAAILQAEDSLQKGANTKLLLTDLFLHL